MPRLRALLAFGTLLLLAPGVAWAGATSFQTSLVPDVANTTPGFRAEGSSLKIVSSGNLRVRGKLKGVADAQGDPVTTNRNDDGDDYCVELDLFVAATDQAGTVTLCFDVRKDNASFKGKLGGGPVFADAEKGDGVSVREIRVLDSAGDVIGSGGLSLRN